MRLSSLSGGTFALCLLALAAACSGGSDDDDEAAVPCTGNADCVPENPCTIGRCGLDGVCAFQAGPDGPAPSELEGDCKRATCRDGVPTYSNDNTDVFDDEEPCTDDTCVNGMPANPISEDGSSCDIGSGSGVCQQGTCRVLCVEGNAASQCNDDDMCTNDVCVPCEDDNCFGQGQCAHEPADGEGPTDNNDCTTDRCQAGEPVHEPAPVGTPCASGGGNVCNAAGDCVDCATGEDCADFEVSNCYVAVCNDGQCDEEPAPQGTIEAGADTVGDCHSPVCSGTGSMINQIDDEDVPDDLNPCTEDSCMDGYAQHLTATSGTSCGAGNQLCNVYGACCTPFVHDDASDVLAMRLNFQTQYSRITALASFDVTDGSTADLADLQGNPDQIVHDPVSGQVFYVTSSEMGLLADCGSTVLEAVALPAPDTATPLSVATALAWDSDVGRVLLASMGGSGTLYGYNPVDNSWGERGDLNNFDPLAASYFSSTSKLYMAGTYDWATTLYRFTPNGLLEDTVTLVDPLVGSTTTHVQIRESGSSLYYILYGHDGLNAFYSFAQVNPATGATTVLFP
jgi:hypothetical protein